MGLALARFEVRPLASMNPHLYNISLQSWEWFTTLTFDSRDEKGRAVRVPDQIARRRMVHAFLRRVAEGNMRDKETGKRIHVIHPVDFLWVVREERGEKGGRYHFHALLAGFPRERRNRVEEFSLRSIWQEVGGGFADVRTFDAQLRGVRYVLKGLTEWSRNNANAFEAGRFNEEGDRTLILADACLVKWGRRMAQGASRGAQSGRPAVPLSARRTRAPLNELETQAGLRWKMSVNMHPAGVSRLF
jgi:hypothetical protein